MARSYHHNHFHVYLQPPKPLEIGGAKKIKVDGIRQSGVSDEVTPNTLTFNEQIDGLKNYADSILQSKGQLTFMFDTTHYPESPMFEIQPASTVRVDSTQAYANKKADYLILNCRQIDDGIYITPNSVQKEIDPGSLVKLIVGMRVKVLDSDKVKVVLVTAPKHGQIKPDVGYDGSFIYDPKPGYHGKDSVEFMVELKGKVYKVIINLVMLESADDSQNQTVCPNNKIRKLSYFGAWQPNLDISVQIKDIGGISLAQTTGTGADAQITLSTTAAGYGWFVDSTPDSNEEFLPTSDPTIWQARPGSAAEGKMDLLSVMLHEYGHALGISHSSDSHDYMAPSLAAGQRRLPTAQELALMQQLVAQLKQQTLTQTAGNPGAQALQAASTAVGQPAPTDSPLPIPIPASFLSQGLLAFTRVHRAEYGWVLDAEKLQLQTRLNPAALDQAATTAKNEQATSLLAAHSPRRCD